MARTSLRMYVCIMVSILYADAYGILEYKHQTRKSDEYIHLYDDAEHIGFVAFRKIPLTSLYVIHSLYVYPEYRKKGHGKALLAYVCDSVKHQGATYAYIQPGPFTLEDERRSHMNYSYQEDMTRLIMMYKKAGFMRVNKIASACAHLVYKIMGIQENAKYLMVKLFQRS